MLKVKGTTAVIITSDGRFIKVRVKGRPPAVGELYCGKTLGSSKTFIRYVAMAAAVVLVLLSFSALKLYYTAYASVVVDVNPSIELMINRWEKIIKAVPLNEDGDKILSRIELTNVSLDAGLKRIVDESIKQKFIDGDRAVNGSSISVNIYYIGDGKKVDLSGFERYLTTANVKYEIKQQSAEKYRREINSRETGAAEENIKGDGIGNHKGNMDGKTDDGTKHNDGYDENQGRKDNKEDAQNKGNTGENTEKGSTSPKVDKNLNNSSAADKGNSDNKGGTNNKNKKENGSDKTGTNNSSNKGNDDSGQKGQIYGSDEKFPAGDKNKNTERNENVNEYHETKTEKLNRNARGNNANRGNRSGK